MEHKFGKGTVPGASGGRVVDQVSKKHQEIMAARVGLMITHDNLRVTSS